MIDIGDNYSTKTIMNSTLNIKGELLSKRGVRAQQENTKSLLISIHNNF